jgi:hypothetical protein
MKNIHIIPTGKPSRLGNVHGKLSFFKDRKWDNTENWRCKNIYITSEEQIKEGERGLSINNAVYTHFNHLGKDYGKKIILTTDQDLINDGVQAIDDEFLEWFVKNPSCEFVEVLIEYRDGYGNWFKSHDKFWDNNKPKFRTRYKIITMTHIEKLHFDAFESDAIMANLICGETERASKESAEITQRIAIEFAEWLNDNSYCWNWYYKKYTRFWMAHPIPELYMKTTKELFQEYLKTKQ